MDKENQISIGYALSGKIMISSVAILIVACFIVALFHVYSRWSRRRRLQHHNRRRRHLATSAAVISSRGLDLCAMNSLPTFIYKSKNQDPPLECAVCLSEFEDNEGGRILPECKHCFHVDCIDMWLQTHCDCPLCRAQVKSQAAVNPESIIIAISSLPSEVMDSGSGSGLHPTCQSDIGPRLLFYTDGRCSEAIEDSNRTRSD